MNVALSGPKTKFRLRLPPRSKQNLNASHQRDKSANDEIKQIWCDVLELTWKTFKAEILDVASYLHL